MSQNAEQLQALATLPSAVNWFKGLFEKMHLEIHDTGEKFTIHHRGDHLEILSGFQGDDPNFVCPLQSENIRNLTGYFADDSIDAYEEYRIVKFMLIPCLKAVLAMPILQNRTFRAAVNVETHWQEALLDPDGKEDEQVTAVHVNDQWLVIPGYHGVPQRRIVMTPAQVLEFQRRVLVADARNSIPAWLELAAWYVKWRSTVTVTVG